MKRMKRLVALFVVIATIASLCAFSIPVSAEEEATTPAVEVTDSDLLRIEKLEALGVIDASYDPATYVTRRTMADIIVKYLDITPSANTDGTPFRDVTMRDPSFASICTLYNMGVITGDDQLRFNPDNYVTYDEALVFIINAIGHKMFAVREGGYPTGYHRVAIKHNMLKGLAMQKGTDPVPVAETAFGDGVGHFKGRIDFAALATKEPTDLSQSVSLEGGIYDIVILKPSHVMCEIKGVEFDAENRIFSELQGLHAEIPCGDLTVTPVFYTGEVNLYRGNGVIALQDRSVLQACLNGNISTTETEYDYADLNGDGVVTLADLDILMSAENYNEETITIKGKEAGV